MLGKRVASAVVLIPLVGLAVYVGGLTLAGVVLIAGLLAAYEYSHLHLASGRWIASYAVYGGVAVSVADAQWPNLGILGPGILSLALVPLALQVFRGNSGGSLDGWATGVAGGMYIGLSLGYFVRLRSLEQGVLWLVVALLGTWICDTGAYFVGVRWGQRPFFPKISPKKTWEGALGGLAFGALAVAALGRALLSVPVAHGLVLGVLVVVAATFGDLAESVIKRQLGAKDSGNLIPGHGGMLDRVDSLLFVVPTVYLFAALLAARAL